jgi:PAS domain S-box-containing protein
MSSVSSSPIGTCLSLTRALSRAASPDDIYTAGLDALSQSLGVSRASVLLFDPDGVMRFKAWRGLSHTYRNAVEGHTPWQPDTPDPQTIVVSDVRTDSSLDDYRATFLDEGIAALAFIPLVNMGRVIGNIVLCYDGARILADDERQLAEVIAAEVAFALARTRAEERSQDNEARLRFALDAAAMGTWELDLRTRLVTWSGNLERIHGYESGAFDNTLDGYERIIHPDDRERVRRSIRWAIEEQKTYDIEYRVVGSDGEVRWVESKGHVDYEDGSAVRLIGLCMAVTRRKEAEFARLATAEEANQLKDEFLATLSHELRTPLNAILGWIGVLEQEDTSTGRVRHALEIVKRNARLQAQLIEDILDVSRIITGKLQIDRQPLNAGALIDSALNNALPAAALKHIEVTRDIPETLPPIVGDSKRLQQVLGNVISNAIKFTPDRGGVHVRSEVSGDMLTIEIQDSGIGIAPTLLPHIFDRFRQGDSRSTRRHGGLGLGLAIARHLAELHGGDIQAHSDGTGRGTTFRIALPVKAGVQPVDRTLSADVEPVMDLSGYNVLVVEDQEDSRELLVRLLHHWGANVLQCPSAHAALSAISTSGFHLMVADIAMPELDGYDLIDRVRRLDSSRGRVPAIAVTAFARREDRERALAAGYNAYCAKPLDTAEFARAIAEVIETESQPSRNA